MINLYHGDCMEAIAKMHDNQYDLAIVDPPYGIGMGNRKGRHSKGQDKNNFKTDKYKTSNWDSDIPTETYFSELFRISKNQIIFGGNYFKLPLSRGWIFWDKEPIIPNYSDGELAWTSFDRVLKRIKIHWNGKIRTGIEPGYKSIHPTQKPKKLYKWILHNYAKRGDKIIDTHGGSMSIAIACYDLGYDLDLWEIDEDYYKAGVKRYNNHISQRDLFREAI